MGKYSEIIEKVFRSHYSAGDREVSFEREDIVKYGHELGIQVPKNLGDLVYSFRYRSVLPDTIKATAPAGEMWVIRPAGQAKYRFALVPDKPLVPNENLATTKIPDSTPVDDHGFHPPRA